MRPDLLTSNRRVLVIDDNFQIQEDFRKILQREIEEVDPFEARAFEATRDANARATFELEFASQGQEGLDMVQRAVAEQRPYAMAFIDVRMPPGLDGIETSSRIWQIDPNLQIVICTAYSDYSWDEMTTKLGRSDRLVILKKPFDHIEALQLASSLTEKWRLLRHTQHMVRDLEHTVAALNLRTALFEAVVDSSPDGLLVVNEHGQSVLQNEPLPRLLKLPPEIAEQVDDKARIDYVSESCSNPAQFREKVAHLNSHRDEASADEIEFKDGRIMERYSAPVRDRAGIYYGRIWSFRDITEPKRLQREIQQTHEKLLLASRRAGMAEVATGALHNVGNVLNSINVTAASVTDSIRASNVSDLIEVVALLRAHESDLGNFMTDDPQGRHLVGYLEKLAEFLVGEQTRTLKDLGSMQTNVDHVKSIVALQQSYAKMSGECEAVRLSDLVDDALNINGIGPSRPGIRVNREFDPELILTLEKHRALQILVNLLRNAREACEAAPHPMLTIRAEVDEHRARITIVDNGAGIAPENLAHLFSHGFTTKKGGHGFGLHSAALTAAEMGGRLSVQSDGLQRGAAFTLELPHPGSNGTK